MAAQIFDRGYRRYDGERTGHKGAMRSLIVHSMRHALGLGRSARYKVIPVFIIVSAYLPAVVFVGVAALFPAELDSALPTYAQYYNYVVAAIYLLVGFIAPQLLCLDRRTGMLGVYLASPLNRASYLVAKAISIFGLMLLVTLGPPLLMLIAFSLQESGPDGFVTWIEVFAKVVASSMVIGVMYSAVAMAVSASTDRWVVATASILALMPGSAVVTDILVRDAKLTDHLHLLNIMAIPRDLIFLIHGERPMWDIAKNPAWTVWLAWLAWTTASIAFVWWRYRRLLVRR